MKNKIVLGIIFVLGILVIGIIAVRFNNEKISDHPTVGSSPKNAVYVIDGRSVTLINGVSSIPVVEGSSSKINTQYFGNEVVSDFDGDGRQDTAFLLTQTTGGSGTFYYAVIALNTPSGYVGSQAFFLGDRIAPQSTEIGKGNTVLVNYAERKTGESFATAPSVGKSVWIKLDPKSHSLGEVVQNFEGEADPSKMSLAMQPWNWIATTYSDGKKVSPKKEKVFAITFKNDKTFSLKTDCNGVGGEYSIDGNKISFSNIISTMMYCEGSQEQEMVKMIQEVQSFSFTSKGELVLGLKYDSGSMIFK